MTLNEKVIKLCNHSGITKTHLEETCGLSQNSINKWDKTAPSIDKLVRVAAYFKMTVDELIAETNFVGQKYSDFIDQTQQTENHIIAYLDFLGIKARLSQGSEAESVVNHNLSVAMDVANYTLRQIPARKIEMNCPNAEVLHAKCFSDNLIIAAKYNENTFSDTISALLSFLSIFQGDLLHRTNPCENFLIRGAVLIGTLSISRNIITGSGVMKAYQAEQERANFPRIIIEEMVCKKIRATIPEKFESHIARDIDGEYYVDFLRQTSDENLIKVQNYLTEEIDKMKNDKAKQKNVWLLNKVLKYQQQRNMTVVFNDSSCNNGIVAYDNFGNVKNNDSQCNDPILNALLYQYKALAEEQRRDLLAYALSIKK